jgi:hypothetical protein
MRMSRRLLGILGCAALACASAASAAAQETKTTTTTTQKTETVRHADGTYTVIEYPADKEVTVELTPSHSVHGAKGLARVLRRGDATTINLDLSGLPADTKTVNLFAVDPAGTFTLLGPVTVANGLATHTFTTPLDKFMLVLSPEQTLTALTDTTPVFFRSAVPEGLAVIPVRRTGDETVRAVGEQVSATTSAAVTPGGAVTTTTSYHVPLLGVPGFKVGEDTMVKVNLAGEMTGARVNFVIEPRKDGPVMIKARFHELKEAPAGRRYVLWAMSPDHKFTRVGQIINTGNRNEAEIRGEVAMADFGLLITAEDATESPDPRGPVVATILR